MRRLGTRLLALAAPFALFALAAPGPARARGSDGLPAVVDLAAAGAVRVDGPAQGVGFGAAGLAVGDLDGDGAADLVVGAPQDEGGRGAVYVVFGTPGELPRSRDLATAGADLTIVGAGPTIGLGVATAVVDLDADGAAELVASTAGYVPALGRLASGGALVFRGGPELRARGRIDLGTERADAAVADASVVTPAGASLAAGDFDGDGYVDLAVGSPAASGVSGDARAGRAIVVFGGAEFPAGRVIDAADASVALVGGKGAGDGLGSDLAAGDVTGDRVDDLLLGTPNRTVLRAVTFEKAGSLFVVAGGDLRPGARVDLAAGGAAIEVLGSDYGDYLGRGAGAGDVTGDGLADIVVGAIDGDGPANARYPDCGEVFVLESPAPQTVDLMQAPEWLWIVGEAPRRFTGNSIAVADLDGDRRAEVVAASESAPGPNGASSGALYVVRGAPGTLDLAIQAAQTTVVGPSSGARLGASLAAADVDGDGTRDLVTGAPGALGGRGSVFVVPGVRTAPDAAPVIAGVADVAAPAGQTVIVRFTATDADGDPIRFALLGRPPGATFADAGDGSAAMTYTPPAGTTGRFDVTVRASDGQLASETAFAVEVVAGAVPRVTKATYRSGTLRLAGENFAAAATVTVNDLAVTRPVVFKPSRARLVVKGTRSELHLDPAPGANRVVVTVDGVASQPFAF